MEDKNKIYLWIFGAIIFLIVALLLFLVYIKPLSVNNDKPKTPLVNNKKSSIDVVRDGIYRKLDGVTVEDGKDNNFPFAVMIDNHIDARPPAGLSKASIVIEAEVEGGITRFMAIFDSGVDAEMIGPIRSARPYFVDWARELSALYVHVGGSPEALVKIIKDSVNDFNEFYNGAYFWRGNDKIPPHNVYASSKNINKYLKKKNLTEGQFFSWKFKNDQTGGLPISSRIKINYLTDNFKVEWKYDREKNNYIRYVAGNPHKEMSGDIITAKNIVIQYVEAEEIDDKLRLKMKIIGNGDAFICLDGSCVEGEWRKKMGSSRTRFYKNNQEIEFNAGNTWIEIVRVEYLVEIE